MPFGNYAMPCCSSVVLFQYSELVSCLYKQKKNEKSTTLPVQETKTRDWKHILAVIYTELHQSVSLNPHLQVKKNKKTKKKIVVYVKLRTTSLFCGYIYIYFFSVSMWEEEQQFSSNCRCRRKYADGVSFGPFSIFIYLFIFTLLLSFSQLFTTHVASLWYRCFLSRKSLMSVCWYKFIVVCVKEVCFCPFFFFSFFFFFK